MRENYKVSKKQEEKHAKAKTKKIIEINLAALIILIAGIIMLFCNLGKISDESIRELIGINSISNMQSSREVQEENQEKVQTKKSGLSSKNVAEKITQTQEKSQVEENLQNQNAPQNQNEIQTQNQDEAQNQGVAQNQNMQQVQEGQAQGIIAGQEKVQGQNIQQLQNDLPMEIAAVDTHQITKTSTMETTTREGEAIPYSMKYKALLSEYTGDITIKIVDTLPYKIDTGKSTYNEWMYDPEGPTLTYEKTYHEAQTIGELQLPELSLVYLDVDTAAKTIDNTVNATIKLKTGEEITNSTSATAKVKVAYETDVDVSKVWEDDSDSRGKRPESVTLVLTGTGEGVNTTHKVKLTTKQEEVNEFEEDDTNKIKYVTGDKWDYTFEGIRKYDENGDEIQYTVTEEPTNSPFYTPENSRTDEATRTITNKFVVPETTISVKVNKQWQDNSNIKNKRPTSLELTLTGKGEGIGESNTTEQTATMTGDTTNNTWTYTFTGVKKYDNNGDEIEYTVTETPIAGKYYTQKEPEGENVAKAGSEENVKEAELTNIMTRQPGTITIKYLDVNTKQPVHAQKDYEDAVGETCNVAADKQEISGYRLMDPIPEETATFAEAHQDITYWYAKETSVRVKYLEKGTERVLKQFDGKDYNEILGYEGMPYTTTQEVIEGYTFINVEGDKEGKMAKETTEVKYYYSQDTSVIVRYLEEDDTPEDDLDNTILHDAEVKEGYEGLAYDVAADRLELDGYEYRSTKGEVTGTMTKSTIEIIYYYAQKTNVVVKYLEQDNDNPIKGQVTVPGYNGKAYDVNEYFTEIDGYTYVGSTENEEGTMTKSNIEVIFYYLKNTSARVEHIDRETGTVLKQETKTGKVGDLFETHSEDIEDYVLVQSPDEANVKMKKDEVVVVKYYYAHVSEGVIEKHIDIISGKVLATDIHKGNEGDQYEIKSSTFEGYDLVEKDAEGNSKLPANSKGKMEKGTIEVKYYYIKKATLRVQYIDKLGGKVVGQDEDGNDIHEGSPIIADIVENKHEKDTYKTEEKQFEGYVLVETAKNQNGTIEITANEDGTENTETVVTYYYIKVAGGVKVQYKDITTGKVIEENTLTGKVTDEYAVSSKKIEGYDLVEEDEKGNSKLPKNNKGKMTEEEIIVKYYYIKKSNVKVEYIYKDTGKILDKEEITGHEGDKYTTEKKAFDGYDLIETTDNVEGKMANETIEVKYYYRKRAEVEVKYLEKGTDYAIEEEELLEGYVNDSYETLPKQTQYYRLVETTDNIDGKMTDDKITVIFYYEKLEFNLKVDQYISAVVVNGENKSAKTFDKKDELLKVEINRKEIDVADVKVTYTIRVTNDGEIEGTVQRLVETLPKGFSYFAEDNTTNWEVYQNALVTTDLANMVIQPGEYKEIQLVLRWNKLQGEATPNTVKIESAVNPANFEDVNLSNNISVGAMSIITVSTGENNFSTLIVAGVAAFMMILMGRIIVCKKKMK